MPLARSLPVPALVFTSQARRLLRTLPSSPGVVVVSGHPESSRLAHYFLAAPLLRGEAVLFLDAANCFNPYRLVTFANQCRRAPREFLERVRISRAFTCFQLAELVERTPAAARRYGARRVVLTGVPDIFDDEELSAVEVKAVFTRTLATLASWPGQGLTALIFSDAAPRPRPLGHWPRTQAASQPDREAPRHNRAWVRGWLHRALERRATAAYRLEETPTGLTLCEATPPKACHSELRKPALAGSRGEESQSRY